MYEDEMTFEECERIKREYNEATPYRILAFGIVVFGPLLGAIAILLSTR